MTLKLKNKITYTSFVLAILVVIRHSVNIEIYNLNKGVFYLFQIFVQEFTDIVVPTFFALSGYLFFQNYEHKLLVSKWKSRVKSLVLPYGIWNILAYFYYELLVALPIVGSYINSEIEPFNMVWLIKNAVWGYHNITWFLRYLILYILVAPILYEVIRKKNNSLFFIIVIYFVSVFFNSSLAIYFSFFCLGGCSGIHLKEYVQREYFFKERVVAFAFLATTVCFGWISGLTISSNLYVLVRMLQVTCIWICADIFLLEREPLWWMKISFFIYCSHSMILESVEKIFLIVFENSYIGALLDFFFAPSITIGIIFSIAWIIKRYPFVWNVLIGYRK